MDPVYIDIHIHTSDNPNQLNDNYDCNVLLERINSLAGNHPVLLSLTDHNTINKNAYMKLVAYHNIFLVIGVELHIKKYETAPPYHCHALFNAEVTEENINEINSVLDDLYPDKVVTDDMDNVPDIEKVSNAFDKFDYMLLPHAGQSHRTFNRSTAKGHKVDTSLEKSVYYNHFDGFTSRSNTGLDGTIEYFKRLGINEFINLVTCSDNYNPIIYPAAKAKDAEPFLPTWMNAIPSFEGLRLSLSESSRLFYGDNPPERWTKTIGNISLSSSTVKIEVDMSPGLNVVIGGSSSGKTLFVDTLFRGITGDFSDCVYNKYKVQDVFIENPSGVNPHYINQNFIVSVLQDSEKQINDIDIIADVFPEDQSVIESIRTNLKRFKGLLEKLVDTVKRIEKYQDDLSHISLPSHLIIDGKIKKNVIDLIRPSNQLMKGLVVSENEFDRLTQSLEELEGIFKRNPLANNLDESVENIKNELKRLYLISSFNDEVYEIIDILKKKEDTRLQEGNQSNIQKSKQREKLVKIVSEYIKDLDVFYSTRNELARFNVSFSTKKVKVCGHELSIENSFKLTPDILVDGINKFIKKEFRIEQLDALIPESLFKVHFSEKPIVKDYDHFAEKVYNAVNSQNRKTYKIITSDGKDFETLSPGWKSAIILDLVLGYEDDIAPIIIDQPEDNLATDYINHKFIELIKTIKTKKQIVLVSHNATIPMLGDAQNVIICDNTCGMITIKSEPLEGKYNNRPVLDYIAEITDGGKPSIKKRVKKYNLKNYKEN